MAWYRQVKAADWASPAEVKRDIRSASILKDGRAVFNIAGNKYCIVVWINYPYRVVYIRFIGSRGRVYEVLNRKRPLSLRMIWRLHRGLGIPAESLIKLDEHVAA